MVYLYGEKIYHIASNFEEKIFHDSNFSREGISQIVKST